MHNNGQHRAYVLAAVKPASGADPARPTAVGMGPRSSGSQGNHARGRRVTPRLASNPNGQKARKCAILGPGAGTLLGVGADGVAPFSMASGPA
jgi:hypothetical protein